MSYAKTAMSKWEACSFIVLCSGFHIKHALLVDQLWEALKRHCDVCLLYGAFAINEKRKRAAHSNMIFVIVGCTSRDQYENTLQNFLLQGLVQNCTVSQDMSQHKVILITILQ